MTGVNRNENRRIDERESKTTGVNLARIERESCENRVRTENLKTRIENRKRESRIEKRESRINENCNENLQNENLQNENRKVVELWLPQLCVQLYDMVSNVFVSDSKRHTILAPYGL